MGISKRLDETLDNLDLDSSAREIKDQLISKSLNSLKEKMSDLDIKVERQKTEVASEEAKPHYEGVELADLARTVYRDNIKSRDRKDKIDAVQRKDPADRANTPSTIASRANVRAISRSLAGMRSSGNEGKTSFNGPNGVGNVGKLSPTGDNGVGNVSNNSGTYYALTTDMTLEEYEKHVQSIFEGDDCECEHEKEEKKKEEIKARGGPPGYPDKSKKTTKEDVVHELEQRLVTLGSTDWIVVDQVLREMARDLDVAPITLSRDFKSVHGMYPDKWIKENLDVEVCGFMPLEEAVRLNKVGKVYEVTFMYRGGTNRLKFFWPHPGDASKEDMQREVEKFWPKGRVLAFYPTIDNEQNSNYMVMASPVTENYHFMRHDDWNEVSEETSEIYNMICEEEGEPISPLMNEEGGYSVVIEDHDTGEERTVYFGEAGPGLHAAYKLDQAVAKDARDRVDTTQQSKSGEKAHKAVTQNINDDQRQGSYRYGSSRAEFKREKERNMMMNKRKARKMTNDPFEADDLAKKADRGEVSIDRDYSATKMRDKKYKVTKKDTSAQDKAIQANKTPGFKKEDHDTGEQRQVNFSEGSLHDWFGKSSSKDGKSGWVNVVTGGTCASDEPGEGTPKCVSSAKRASMSEAERKSASRRKKAADPNQQSKSGAAKPTNVKTDVKEELLDEEKDKKGKGSGSKDACYHKVKSRYSVWPSAYASGALVKCRAKGAKNWGNSSKKEEVEYVDEDRKAGQYGGKHGNYGFTSPEDEKKQTDEVKRLNKIALDKRRAKKEEVEFDEGVISGMETSRKIRKNFRDKKMQSEENLEELKCWTGYKRKKGAVPGAKGSCVKEEEEVCPICGYNPCQCLEGTIQEGDEMKGLTQKGGHKRSTESGAGLTQKGVDAVNRKTGGNLKTAVTTPPSKLKPGSKAAGRRKSFCARSRSWDGERGKAARRRWNC